MRYFSMFSGIGGFELGLQNATQRVRRLQGGHAPVRHSADDQDASGRRTPPVCVGYSEIDKYAIKVYDRRFNGHQNYGDATTIDTGNLPDFDLVVGGFPCQAFSIAGRRAGFDDTRGTLFFEVARILRDKRPGHFVLENVKGLLSHDGGKTFQAILGILAELGYRVEWQILNSKDHGVAQNRERVYFIGHLRDECRRTILPLRGADGSDTGQAQPQTAYALTEKRTDEAKAIRREHQKQGRDFSPRRGKVLEPRDDNQVGALTASRNLENLLATPGIRIRRLTPIECERLQGFPDDWTEGESDTQRYKMCGNAVTVNVAEAVMTELMPCLA